MRFLGAKLAKTVHAAGAAPDPLGKAADALRFIFPVVELN